MEIRPPLIGAGVPAVTVQTAGGEEVDLRETVLGKPTILLFYRGGW